MRKKFVFATDSTYKAIVYFKNRESGFTFYSRDKPTPQIGLLRLQKMINNFNGKYNTALIYNNNKQLVEKYIEGKKVL